HLKDNEPPSSWGPVELVAVIAGPVFLVFVVVIIVVFIFHHHQRVYHNRQRLDMEDPSCEMCLSKDKTLQDLVYDLSTSGSGSGRKLCLEMTKEDVELERVLAPVAVALSGGTWRACLDFSPADSGTRQQFSRRFPPR
ncbi:hypothetical protein ASZ78_013925, partial [Callipepla squamata]